jgi:bacillolysin
MKRFYLLMVVYVATMLSVTYAQNMLQLVDTITDEKGRLRHFRLNSTESVNKANDTIAFLKRALGTNENVGFRLVKTKTRRNNQKSVLYQQLYDNVPVYDAYYYLHYTDETFTHANGEYAEIERPTNSPLISEAAAIDAAVKSASVVIGLKPNSTKAKLTLWKQDTQSSYSYVYEVEVLFVDATKSKICMVDAESGEVLVKEDEVCYVNVPSTGATVYSGNRNFTGDTFAGGVRLREERDGVNISTLNNQNNVAVNTVDFVNSTTTWTSAGANEGALDVHFGVEMFLDYFRTVFDRSSIDDDDHEITSLVNRWELDDFGNPRPMDNAFFRPSEMMFSFGNGNNIFNSVTSLDVVAHELAHGFAHFEVGFNATGEARSLNEGFSDIWGATVENWSGIQGKEPWMMGEEIMANGFSCLRSLRNPSGEGFRPDLVSPPEGNYPDTRLGNFWDVNNTLPPHINATVLGHWYFLLSQGGTGTNDLSNNFNVTGLGIQTAAQIAYNTELALTPSADFMSVRTASIAYATQEWGTNSCEVKTVTDAWFAVGVGSAYNGTLGASLSGSSIICTGGATFTLSNVPAGVTVTWAASPTYFQTNSGSGTSASLIPINSEMSGSGIITFTITGCGNPVQVQSNNFWVGPPSGGIYFSNSENESMYFCSSSYGNHFEIDSEAPSGNFEARLMDITGQTVLYTSPISTHQANIPNLWNYYPSSNGYYVFEMRGTNECGSTSWLGTEVEYVDCSWLFAVYPNPADNYVDVEMTDYVGKTAETELYQITLIDDTGTELLSASTKSKKQRINTSNLKMGQYILRIQYKGELTFRRIVIDR